MPWIKPVLSANGERSSAKGKIGSSHTTIFWVQYKYTKISFYFFLIKKIRSVFGQTISFLFLTNRIDPIQKSYFCMNFESLWGIFVVERAWEVDQSLDVIQLAELPNGSGGGASPESKSVSLNRPKLQNGRH